MREFEILKSFFQQSLKQYPAESESLLNRLDDDNIHRASFRYIFSVESMIKISHIIENSVLLNRGLVDLHVSFQYMSRLEPQLPVYRQLSQFSKGLWLYGALEDTDLNRFGLTSRRTFVIDTGQTPLINYWFVIAYGPGVSMALIAEEIPSVIDGGRNYEGFYTFESDVSYEIIMLLHLLFPQSVPKPVQPEQLMKDG